MAVTPTDGAGRRRARPIATLVLLMCLATQLAGVSAASPDLHASQALPACQPADPQVVSQASRIGQSAAVQQVLDGFNQGFAQFQQQSELAGLAVAVVSDQSVIWARGFGCADISQQSPATAETVYGVGSVTKMFTATMLMQLQDAGMLRIDDPVNKYVPGAEYKAPDGGTVSPTFVELASHTSGLPRDVTTLPQSMQQMLQELQQTAAQSQPGTTFAYSNYGYMVLGQVLAEIAGQPYERYIEQHILRPLGMRSSGFDVPRVPQSGYATPYTSINPPQPTTYLSPGFYNPAAGLNSTAVDMAQFLKLQFSDGTVDSHTILSPAALQQMRRIVTNNAPGYAAIAIGWEYYVPGSTGLTFIGKDGDITGFASQLLFIPDANAGVFLVTNTLDVVGSGNTALVMLEGAEQAMVNLVPAIPQATGGK